MATGSLIGDRIIPDDLPGCNEKIKQFMGVILQVYQKVFEYVHPFAELEPVLKRLKERGVKLGALTSSRAVAVCPLYRHALSP